MRGLPHHGASWLVYGSEKPPRRGSHRTGMRGACKCWGLIFLCNVNMLLVGSHIQFESLTCCFKILSRSASYWHSLESSPLASASSPSHCRPRAGHCSPWNPGHIPSEAWTGRGVPSPGSGLCLPLLEEPGVQGGARHAGRSAWPSPAPSTGGLRLPAAGCQGPERPAV